MKIFFSKVIIFLGVFFLIMGTMTSFGMNKSYAVSLQIIGNDLGLEVIPSGTKLFDLTNLNPGDKDEEKVDIKNNHTLPFEVFMRAERTSPQPEMGEADLFEQLIVTVYLDGEKIYTGPMKDYAISSISLGNFNPNVEKELKAVVHLPGPETGNEFQNKNVDVKWIFTATAKATEDPENPEEPQDPEEPEESDEPERPTGPKESQELQEEIIEIIEQEIPTGVPELEEEESIEEDLVIEDSVVEEPVEVEEIIEIEKDVPLGIINLPKTGEISSTVYYILGIALLSLGIGTGAKKKR